MSEMLSVGQAAEFLKVSKWLVYKLVKNGMLPNIRIGGKRLLFRKSSLENWLQQQETSSTSTADNAINHGIRKLKA